MSAPTIWRASKTGCGRWRVIRTTDLGFATRVEEREAGTLWDTFREADEYAAFINTETNKCT